MAGVEFGTVRVGVVLLGVKSGYWARNSTR